MCVCVRVGVVGRAFEVAALLTCEGSHLGAFRCTGVLGFPRTLIRARASSLLPTAVASCCHPDGREQKRRDCVAVRSSPAGRVGRCWSLPGDGAAVWLLSFSIMEPGARDLHGWSRWPTPSPACCCPVIAPAAKGGRGIRLPTFKIRGMGEPVAADVLPAACHLHGRAPGA